MFSGSGFNLNVKYNGVTQLLGIPTHTEPEGEIFFAAISAELMLELVAYLKCICNRPFLTPVYTAQTNSGSTRVSFYRVNTANPGSTRVKSNQLPEVSSTRVEPGLG